MPKPRTKSARLAERRALMKALADRPDAQPFATSAELAGLLDVAVTVARRIAEEAHADGSVARATLERPEGKGRVPWVYYRNNRAKHVRALLAMAPGQTTAEHPTEGKFRLDPSAERRAHDAAKAAHDDETEVPEAGSAPETTMHTVSITSPTGPTEQKLPRFKYASPRDAFEQRLARTAQAAAAEAEVSKAEASKAEAVTVTDTFARMGRVIDDLDTIGLAFEVTITVARLPEAEDANGDNGDNGDNVNANGNGYAAPGDRAEALGYYDTIMDPADVPVAATAV